MRARCIRDSKFHGISRTVATTNLVVSEKEEEGDSITEEFARLDRERFGDQFTWPIGVMMVERSASLEGNDATNLGGKGTDVPSLLAKRSSNCMMHSKKKLVSALEVVGG